MALNNCFDISSRLLKQTFWKERKKKNNLSREQEKVLVFDYSTIAQGGVFPLRFTWTEIFGSLQEKTLKMTHQNFL